MTEGWKEQIKLSVGYDPGYWDIEEVHSEIDHVYTQASKADEYEAKAKAFDKVLHSYDTAPSYDEIGEEVIEIVNKFRGSEW